MNICAECKYGYPPGRGVRAVNDALLEFAVEDRALWKCVKGMQHKIDPITGNPLPLQNVPNCLALNADGDCAKYEEKAAP